MRREPDYPNMAAILVIAFFIILTLALNDPCSEWSAEEAMELQCE